MEITHLIDKDKMLSSFELILELYPDMTQVAYLEMLSEMGDNYGQIQVWDNDKLVGLSGYWIGIKLWCGKYLELDNVVVSNEFRSKGIGQIMCDYLEEFAMKESCNMLCLDAYTDNFKAGKFYMNQGYIPRGFHYIKKIR